MKNVLIFYGSYGGGHLSAAKSMRDFIHANYPDCNVEMIDCIEYINKFFNKISTGFYSSVAKNAPKMWGKIYYGSNAGVLSGISNSANKLMSNKLLKLISVANPDLIISTHPFSSNMCSYLKRKKKIDCKLATIMTDFALHNQWLNNLEFTDYIFVAHEKMRENIINRGFEHEKIFTTGIPISPRFSEVFDKDVILSDLGLSNDLPICIFFGGGEYGFGKIMTEKVFNVLVSNFSKLQVIAIAGKNEKLKSDFEKIVKKNNCEQRVKVLGFTNMVPEYMSVASFVISKSGGLTTSECLASHLPLLVISPLPGQEEDNAEFVEHHNTGYWIKEDDDIAEILDVFITNLDIMRDCCKSTGKKSSTADICNILLNN